MRVPDISRIVGTLLQDPERQVINYKVEEEIAFAPENFNLPKEEILQRMEASIDAVGIASLKGRETSKLSGGEMQRVALAAVLTMDPRILILDEPTSNIDPEGTREIFQFLRQEKGKRTLIIIEHKVERVLPFVDRVVVVDNGGIVVDDRKDELIKEAHKLVELGIEIPRHILLASKLGIDSYDPEEIRKVAKERGMLLEARARATDSEEIFKSRVSLAYRDGFSLEMPIRARRGTITAIMGRNGAGKSSLLKGLIGFIDRDLAEVDSTIEIDGKVHRNPELQVRGRYLGYLPQSFDLMLVNKTVDRELNYSIRVRKLEGMQEFVDNLKKIFSLEDYAKSDPLALSQGQRRRVAMASTLAGGVKVIMMDEPTSGQDYFHKENLGHELTHLKNMGYTFLIVTHDARFVYRYADSIAVMDRGRLVMEGTPEEVFLHSEKYGIVPPSEFYLREDYELPAR